MRLDPSAPASDQRIVLHGMKWWQYEMLLDARGDGARPRLAYRNGDLELMSSSREHEKYGSLLGRLIEAYAIWAEIELCPYGSWTLKQAVEEKGAEPDECYIFGADQAKAVPDLVIEVIWTSGGIDKLDIYLALRVSEVWFWKDERLEAYALRGDRYEVVARSAFLPELDLGLLGSLLDRPTLNQARRDLLAALGAP